MAILVVIFRAFGCHSLLWVKAIIYETSQRVRFLIPQSISVVIEAMHERNLQNLVQILSATSCLVVGERERERERETGREEPVAKRHHIVSHFIQFLG